MRYNDFAGYTHLGTLGYWVNGDLPTKYEKCITAHQADGLGVSLISCWEVAKLVEYQRLVLRYPVDQWLQNALVSPNIILLDLTLQTIVESTQLPQPFHRDPADQLIVATARVQNIPLLTLDKKIIDYPHIRILKV